jgi:hypothetical protein
MQLLGLRHTHVNRLLSDTGTAAEMTAIFDSAFETLSRVDNNKCRSLKAYLSRLATRGAAAAAAVDGSSDAWQQYADWEREIDDMRDEGFKCELEALYSFIGPARVTEFIRNIALMHLTNY